MKRWTGFAKIIAALGITLMAGGCAGTRFGVYATMPPPPLRVEVIGNAPGPGFLWIRGYWDWRAGGFAWVPGRWDRIPPGRHRWEDGRWIQRGDRYYRREGRWR
jgi:hypothetical protein